METPAQTSQTPSGKVFGVSIVGMPNDGVVRFKGSRGRLYAVLPGLKV